MNHLTKITSSLFCAAVILSAAGCGDSNAEKLAKEKEQQRLEIEKQAARELQQANKALAEIGKKIGRKAQPLDLNLPDTKQAEPAPTAPKP